MEKDILVVTYGDEIGSGRGLYRVSVCGNKLDARLVYQCSEKPGAVTAMDDQWLFSYRDSESQSGIRLLCIDSDSDSGLVVKYEVNFPYFISSFCRIADSKQYVGSSFYDGVDVTFEIDRAVRLTSVSWHAFRSRSDDVRQSVCHPHHINQFWDEPWVYSVDMGIDSVSVYSLQDSELRLSDQLAIDSPLGTGSRIMRLHPNRRFAYLLHEISNAVAVYTIHREEQTERPLFNEIQRLSTLLPTQDSTKSSAAGCVITEDGRFLLVTNRGEDSLVLFRIDNETGTLTLRDRLFTARTPRDICVVGELVIIAAQDANSLQLVRIDTDNQTLHLLDELIGIPQPVSFIQYNF